MKNDKNPSSSEKLRKSAAVGTIDDAMLRDDILGWLQRRDPERRIEFNAIDYLNDEKDMERFMEAYIPFLRDIPETEPDRTNFVQSYAASQLTRPRDDPATLAYNNIRYVLANLNDESLTAAWRPVLDKYATPAEKE